ncbi:MAG: RpiB/LacA/LacB family sugar-phosphate isomerase [Bacteroidetes bacterium]|nr:RpiB/LacA/LacB family sugar-phosphate isomerase [Bacteroidota bacterium]
MKIGIAADHGGFELKEYLKKFLEDEGYAITDYGAYSLNPDDDYPDFVIPLAKAVSEKKMDKGIAICGSGVGAAIAANKIKGIRAALINDHFSAHQGVEDDNMNMLCLGGRVTASSAAEEYTMAFLLAVFSGLARHKRRLKKIADLEK